MVKCITMKHSRSQFELGPKGHIKYQQPMIYLLVSDEGIYYILLWYNVIKY